MNKSPTSKSSAAYATADRPNDFAPGPISKDASIKHFERGAKASLERNRWFFVSVILGAALVANGVAWNVLLPLKSVETYQVNQVDKGRLVVDGTPLGSWAPDDDAVDYFLNQWANKTWDINGATIEGTIAESAEQAVGTAKVQLQEMRKKENPYTLLKDYPGYSRTYETISINKVKDDVRLIRFRTITRLAPTAPPRTTTYALTVTFTRIKPRTRADVLKNPAGLYITSFNPTEEFETK